MTCLQHSAIMSCVMMLRSLSCDVRLFDITSLFAMTLSDLKIINYRKFGHNHPELPNNRSPNTSEYPIFGLGFRVFEPYSIKKGKDLPEGLRKRPVGFHEAPLARHPSALNGRAGAVTGAGREWFLPCSEMCSRMRERLSGVEYGDGRKSDTPPVRAAYRVFSGKSPFPFMLRGYLMTSASVTSYSLRSLAG